MPRKIKHILKKEKAIASVVSSALMTAPFLVGSCLAGIPATANATEITDAESDGKTVDYLQTVVVPQSGTTSIDLKAFLDGEYYYVDTSDSTIASYNADFVQGGLLQIHGEQAGTATFTVSIDVLTLPEEGEGGWPEYSTLTETFDVVVVPSYGEDNHYDIGDAVSTLRNAASAEEAHNLLQNVGPIETEAVPSYNQAGNHVPTVLADAPAFEAYVDTEIYLDPYYMDTFDITEFVTDQDEDDLRYYFTSSGDDIVSVVNNMNSDHIFIGQTIVPKKAGTTKLPVLVMDGKGGMVETVIPIHVNHTEVYDLDSDAELNLDLNTIFTDMNAATVYYNYETLQADYPEGEPFMIEGSTLNVYSHDGLYKVTAKDGDKEESRYFRIKWHEYSYSADVFEGSELELNLPKLFKDALVPGGTVTYSVYQENPEVNSVTDITYGMETDSQTLFIHSDDEMDYEYNPVRLTVIAKDKENHKTVVETIQSYPKLAAGREIPLYDLGIYYYYPEGDDVPVIDLSDDSDTMNFEIVLGQYSSDYVIKSEEQGTANLTISIDDGAVTYKIPYFNIAL